MNYPKPREGTETRPIASYTIISVLVELPQAPRGDGNREMPLSMFSPFLHKLNYPKPREGTETCNAHPCLVVIKHDYVELPQAPRGDGN